MKTLDIPCTGYSVKADWYDGESTGKILLVLIGWKSNRKKYERIVSDIVAATGTSALVIEYSGHGDSPFKLTETRPAQHFLEVIYAFDWVREQYPDADISVMGTSYGGFLGAQLTKYRTFKQLILRVPALYRPEDFYNLAFDVHETLGTYAFRKDKEAVAKHPLFARASRFAGKTLVIAHELDEYIPLATTDAYTKAFNADYYLAKDTPHSDRDEPPEKKAAYNKFIADWLNKA